ncbi:down syndrome cell adhesion molecule-like protein Dscam2 [Caerostris extrusa]|uniref:Down syndrome cell adhesion molecule-like protein Dscam2 n=1 Tax=Caerostris extrusa TaxID=172846 RepID=A0AAV4N4Z6_CAEEX|nr:down syndrome cell adhesion molecule-like protein Dscam2 [Caerostris extrusa]
MSLAFTLTSRGHLGRARMFVLLEESPRFETKFRTQMVKKGDDVTLTCSVSGDPPLSITWTRDKQPLNLETEPSVTSVGRVDSALKHAWLLTCMGKTTLTSNLLSRHFFCGSKKVGSFQVTISLYPTEQPDAPREVQISETGSRLVRLSWEPPFSGNSLITKYILHIRENGKNSFLLLPEFAYFSVLSQVCVGSASSQSRNISVPGTNTSADISDLRPSTGYDVYLIAENAIGPSGAGRTFHFKTEEEVPDGPPTAVKAEAIGPDALRISWEVEKAAKYAEAQMLRGFVRLPKSIPARFRRKTNE